MNNLKSLKIQEANLKEPVQITKELYDGFVLYSPTSSIKGKREYKYKHFDTFVRRIQNVIKSFNIASCFNSLYKNFFGIYSQKKPDYDCFFRSIRNSIAHGNIAVFKSKIYFFQVKKYSKNISLEELLEKELSFILVLKNMNQLKVIYEQYKSIVGRDKLKI